jgi:hypothetical protein
MQDSDAAFVCRAARRTGLRKTPLRLPFGQAIPEPRGQASLTRSAPPQSPVWGLHRNVWRCASGRVYDRADMSSSIRRSRRRPKPDRRREKSKVSSAATEQPSPSKSPPSEGTAAALAYATASIADLQFFHFIIQTVTRSDYATYVAKQALDGKDRDEVKSPDELLETAPGAQTKILRRTRKLCWKCFLYA